jgi:hypothetical protein
MECDNTNRTGYFITDTENNYYLRLINILLCYKKPALEKLKYNTGSIFFEDISIIRARYIVRDYDIHFNKSKIYC